MAFKGASSNEQARLRRVIPSRLPGFNVEPLTDEEYLERLRLSVTKVERQLFLTRKGDPQRKILAAQKQQIVAEITRINPPKGPSSFMEHFRAVCRERLNIEVFESIYREASKRAQATHIARKRK